MDKLYIGIMCTLLGSIITLGIVIICLNKTINSRMDFLKWGGE